jgi:hypothetical protein
MKKQLFFYLLTLLSFSSFAQSKATLTKEETVNYINKKQAEVIGHYRTVKDGGQQFRYYYWNTSTKLSGNDVVISTTRSPYQEKQYGKSFWESGVGSLYEFPCNYYVDYHDNTFNPMHIKSIELDASNVYGEPVGLVKITLKSNTGKSSIMREGSKSKVVNTESNNYGKCCNRSAYLEQTYNNKETTSVIYLTFLQSDDTNFSKIKKALEHLRDLYKAEDDPFGE